MTPVETRLVVIYLDNEEQLLGSPITRKKEQKTIVRMMNQVFHSWLLFTVATPRNMKMMVSDELLNIFKAYFIVVWDLCDTLAST